ncbi:MAG: tRNA (cytidine(56)-2'-O)-methyltransferase [TACK group archaeon]|nr:tRNA (cytidine(56)-2'-O)-methyltransferase [TACK group archaeon]
MRVVILRYGHRRDRDKRVTTHVALVARAFGAEGMLVWGDPDPSLEASMARVVSTWGGSFWLRWISSYVDEINAWKKEGGMLIHLTMYGQQLDEALREIVLRPQPLMIFVGASKVPPEIYRLADYNVSVGNQPHSEVAALAVFLDHLFHGEELGQRFNGSRVEIKPSRVGKVVLREGVRQEKAGKEAEQQPIKGPRQGYSGKACPSPSSR